MAKKSTLMLYTGDDWWRSVPRTGKFQKSYNVYREVLAKRGMLLTRASIKWFRNGRFLKYWQMGDDNRWYKVRKPFKPTVIEDRVRDFNTKTGAIEIQSYLQKVNISKSIPVFNYPEFTNLLDNKLNQAAIFHQYMPNTKLWLPGETVRNPRGKKIVLKSLGGLGGDYVMITNAKRVPVKQLKLQQEFIDAKKNGALKDTRIVFIGDRPVYSFQRKAKKGSFHTNLHLGGTFEFIPLSSIQSLVTHAKKIAEVLEVFPKKLFSLDFMIDTRNNKAFLIESNTKPTLEAVTGTVAQDYFNRLADHILS